MCHMAEIVHRHIQITGLQMGKGRTPHTEVYEVAALACLQKLPSVWTQITHLRDKLLPGMGKGPISQVINSIRMPQWRAEPKQSIFTQSKAIFSHTAPKQWIVGAVDNLLRYKIFTIFLEHFEPFRIWSFQGHDLLRGEPFWLDLFVSHRIAVIPHVYKGVTH